MAKELDPMVVHDILRKIYPDHVISIQFTSYPQDTMEWKIALHDTCIVEREACLADAVIHLLSIMLRRVWGK